MKELEELTADIREKLPRLKELPIIGLEPMLNDVLEWLSLKSDTIDYYGFDSAGNYLWFNHALNKFSTNPTVKWTLSNPYIKDQSPELIKFLHSLIKTKQ
ncbi:hypothetical protein [Chryseobacterium sp. ON_d1]|uniref:hypothetical protein n=1 Tax=Chryseobacterium sp. ON_d1 TaxID=2583211 RepID=UPI00115B2EA6|nr:hypothetical protein [Chryseobacterium sp. ON_d1]GEJ46040.1 hypothetical protein CRS_26480 [Chryseobacterium sp. ON_d1]